MSRKKKQLILSNQKLRNPSNTDVCLLYCDMLKLYTRTLKTKKAQYTLKQLTIIEESINTNKFWENWKNLNKTKPNEPVIQDGDIWINHFKILYSNIHIKSDSEQFFLNLKQIRIGHQRLTEPFRSIYH